MLRKHSISIRAHKTSYTLEDEFFNELVQISAGKNITVAALITGIDAKRPPGTNLASAIRLYILQDLKSR